MDSRLIRLGIAVILCCIFCLQAKATFCVDMVFKEEKVTLYLCQNHSGYNETRSLLFKARASGLNDHIAGRIKEGTLKDKKFEIQIHNLSLY